MKKDKGTAGLNILLSVKKFYCPLREQSFNAKPEFRLKSGSRQDRSVKHLHYARTTNKGNLNGWIYSLTSYNNINKI